MQREYPGQACSTPAGPPRLTLHLGCGGSVGGDFRCDRCGTPVGFGGFDLQPGPGFTRA